jgi:Tc toxin complex TcA C-terminal TcB-binding domain/PKD domain
MSVVSDSPHVIHAIAAFTDNDDRAALRTAIRKAAAAADASQPDEIYSLARYAVLAGDYEMAASLARRIPDHDGVRTVIDPILATSTALSAARQTAVGSQPRAPELPYPENFYTYHNEFYPLDVLNDVQRQIAAVGQPPRDASQAYPGFADRGMMFIRAAVAWFEALKQWQIGNAAFNARNYAVAQATYDACQATVCDYFSKYYGIDLGSGSLRARLSALIAHLAKDEVFWGSLWTRIRQRRSLLTLDELSALDWPDPARSVYIEREFNPAPVVGSLPPKPDYGLGFIQRYFRRGEFGDDPAAPRRQNDLEAPLITLAFVFVPLARAEVNRARRQFEAALRDLRWVLDGNPLDSRPGQYARVACEFIERPFARLLLAETMLDRADVEYKARIPAEPEPVPDVTAYQGLKAAQTYLAIKDEFKNEGEYVARAEASRAQLSGQIEQRLAANDTRSLEYQLLGKDILVPTVASRSKSLPGLDRRLKAHEPLLKFTPPDGQSVMRETNPRVYAALLTAVARLEQLKAGFNYLGYLDTYIPPWRFPFLLERARYFAEHAKNAQREYLNFLGNAEREEFQELSASQNVEMEKSNVRIETARVDQVLLEVQAAKESANLADLHAKNAAEAFKEYLDYDRAADEADQKSMLGSILGGVAQLGGGLATGNAALAIQGGVGFFDATFGGSARLDAAAAERQLEKRNLERASGEAAQSAAIAGRQLAAASAGLVVAGLQRQAALLRHEFAVLNLSFLRNRILNAEQWYRLVAAIRSVSETYLRYSIELAFLTEQAYEFEADKRINVIRFDYDLSEVGDFLAADFLARDLDTLEQDLVVTQRQRQQHVRYVLSMAREFPQALQDLRDTGKATFSLRLEQLEKRFPGLYNLRIGAVDVLPVALLDPTRFSLELTHLGTSQVRLKTRPDTRPGTPSSSPLNTNDLSVPTGEWLAGLEEEWPIKLRVTGPETDVFSGLTRQDATAVFAFATNGQRHAFEGLGGAAAWQVDFTARDNQVVPGTLADLLITFTLSGYHDPELRAAIASAAPQTSTLTTFMSAQQSAPDAFYEFNRTGRMVWRVRRETLSLQSSLGRLRNIGMSLRPGVTDVNFSRLLARLRVNFRIDEAQGTASGVTVFTPVPDIAVTQTTPLTVQVRAALNTASELTWDFGDGTPVLRTARGGTEPIRPAQGTHTYAKPGRYVLTLRCVQDESLSEFRIAVVVSRTQKLGAPLVVLPPRLMFDTANRSLRVAANGAVQEASRLLWRVGDLTAEGDAATFKLKPGHYSLEFVAARKLRFRAYGTQRYVHGDAVPPLPLSGMAASTNRTFDENGKETNGTGSPTPRPARNELAKRLFGAGEISPADDWTFELVSEDIVGVPAETLGSEQLDLSDIQDVVLSMEYDVTA